MGDSPWTSHWTTLSEVPKAQGVMNCLNAAVRSPMLPNANVSTLVLNAHSCASAMASVIENDNKHQKICAFAESIVHVLYNTIVLLREGCRLFFMHKCLSYI